MKRASQRFELLEMRQVMDASNDGAVGSIEGEPYQLALTQDYGVGIQWKINWGDGMPVQTVTGAATQVSHTFNDGSSTPVVTAELYKPDVKLGLLSPEGLSVGFDVTQGSSRLHRPSLSATVKPTPTCGSFP